MDEVDEELVSELDVTSVAEAKSDDDSVDQVSLSVN